MESGQTFSLLKPRYKNKEKNGVTEYNSNCQHAAGRMAQRTTVGDSVGLEEMCVHMVCCVSYGCVCIWVCMHMVVGCMHKYVNCVCIGKLCMHMGVYAHGCVCIWVCMHVCELYIG